MDTTTAILAAPTILIVAGLFIAQRYEQNDWRLVPAVRKLWRAWCEA